MAKKSTKKIVTTPEVVVPVIEETTVVETTVKKLNDYQLVYFSASWCAPCKVSKPIVEKICTEQNIDYNIFVADVEKEGKEIASSLNVRSVPTIIFYNNGEEVHRHIGAIIEPKLVELIKMYVK